MRDLKYVSKIAIKNAVLMTGMLAAVLVLFATVGGEYMQQGIGGMVLVYAFIMGGMSVFSMYTDYIRMSQTMGGTRKNFFLAAQAGKIIICVICLAAIALGQLVVNNVGGMVVPVQFISMENVVVMGAIIIVSMSATELAGLLCAKIGKVAMVIFMAVIGAGYGLVGGLMMSSINHDNGGIIARIMKLTIGNWEIVLLSAAASVVLMAISWMTARKICVKG